jgi:mono/diheme cytochrome c family protein
MTHAPPVPLVAAQAAIALVLVFELVLLARFLSWRRDQPRKNEGRNLVLCSLLLAAVFAFAAGRVARTGALAPGVSGAGMPWESVTDDTPLAGAAQAGQRAYLNRCAPCHLPAGLGLPPAYPPLVGSVFLSATKEAHAQVALWGSDALSGRPRVAGRSRMPAFAGAASDAELSAILTYERVAFDLNRRREESGSVDPDSARHHVRPSDVAKARAQGAPR